MRLPEEPSVAASDPLRNDALWSAVPGDILRASPGLGSRRFSLGPVPEGHPRDPQFTPRIFAQAVVGTSPVGPAARSSGAKQPMVKRAAIALPETPVEPLTDPISLVLIDDNRLLREGIAAVIRSQPEFQVLAASADATEALDKVRENKPDIVLLDFGLEDHDSLSLTRKVRQEVPEARVIIMGLLPAQEDVATYVRAGASGFIMKDASFEEFFATIRAVATGVEVLPQALTNSLFTQIIRNVVKDDKQKVVESVRMTNREQQIIGLLGEGLSNKEIANRLHIAVHTVKSHVHNVLEKLALHSRLEVVAFTHSATRRRTDEKSRPPKGDTTEA
jgi:DNA-binding NarL/FixJ family response regulator